jgi:hypothetical protein
MKEEKELKDKNRFGKMQLYKEKKVNKRSQKSHKDKSKNISMRMSYKRDKNNKITPKNIMRKILRTHDTTIKKYNILNINAIIFDQKNHKVATFKNYLIWDESSEFFKRYYKLYESVDRIPKISEYYEEYTLFAPIYFGLDSLILLIMNKWSKKKKKYLEYLEDKEDEDSKSKIKRKDFKPLLNNELFNEKTVEQKSMMSNYTKSKTTLDLSKFDFYNDNFNYKYTDEDNNKNLMKEFKQEYNSPIREKNTTKSKKRTNEVNENFKKKNNIEKSISFSDIINDLSSNYSIILNINNNNDKSKDIKKDKNKSKKDKKSLTINIETCNNKKVDNSKQKNQNDILEKRKKFINIVKTQPNSKMGSDQIVNLNDIIGNKNSFLNIIKKTCSKDKTNGIINNINEKDNKNSKIKNQKKKNIHRNVSINLNKINNEITKSKKLIITKLSNLKSKIKSTENSLSKKQNKKTPINKIFVINALTNNFILNKNIGTATNSKTTNNTINNSKKKYVFPKKINLTGINNDTNLNGKMNLEDLINKNEYRQSLTDRGSQIFNLKNMNINHSKINTNSNIFCNISLNRNIESLSHRISKLTKNKTISLTTPESLLKIKNIKKDIIKKKNVVYDNKNNSISNHNIISNYLDVNRSNMNKNVFEHKKNLVLKQFNSKKEISYFWKNRNESSKTYSLNEINNIRGSGNSSVSNSQKKKSNYLVPKTELIGDKKSKKNHQKKINLNLNLHINLNINIAKKNKKTLSGNLMNNNCLKCLLTQRNVNVPKRNAYNKLLSIYHSKNKLTKNIKSETSFK